MTNPTIYQGTIGADLELQTSADLVTGVASVEISVRTPSGIVTTWTPDSITAGVGVWSIAYSVVSGDLDEYGTYIVQPVVTMDNGDVWLLCAAEWVIHRRYEVV